MMGYGSIRSPVLKNVHWDTFAPKKRILRTTSGRFKA
jgi:hypothetical protein